jgi:hypothetical protein
MARKYTRKRKGGSVNEKLQAHFNDLEMIVEKINSDVKELKEQLQSSNVEASGVEETNTADNEQEYSNDDNITENEEDTNEKSLDDNVIENEEDTNEKSLDDKKAEISELIAQAQNILYDGTNCDFKMKQKPCSTGKETLSGFERSVDKLTSSYKADDLKENIENYISKIKDQLNMKGGRKTRRHRKTRKHGKRHTKRTR